MWVNVMWHSAAAPGQPVCGGEALAGGRAWGPMRLDRPAPDRNGWIKRGFNALLTRPPTRHSLSPFRSAAAMRLHPGLGKSTSV